ncbi:hypothetical protein [Nocardioides convexus]|nr:hypothetical protein [Nocardioides convexus]
MRSPQTERRQALIVVLGALLPIALVHFSRNWMTEVWSKTSEDT